MTNYIEKKNESSDREREKMLSELMKLRVSLPTEDGGEGLRLPPSVVVHGGVHRWLPPSGSSMYMANGQDDGENEEESEYDIVIDDDDDEFFVTPNQFDLNEFEDNISVFEDSDGDSDSRSYFPCPFCYVEIEIPVLCSHMQEEHCFDLRNAAVCPLCAATLGSNATGHFIAQHKSSLKRKRRTERHNSFSGNSAMLGQNLVTNVRASRYEPMNDPLLSPFVYNGSFQCPNRINQDELSGNISAAKIASNEKEREEMKQKAEFVQQLTLSTIFKDIW